MTRQIVLAITLGCFCSGLAVTAHGESETKPKAITRHIAEGAKGFAGMISGRIVSKGEDQVVVEVLKIDRTWKHSKAENPGALVGQQLAIKIVPQVYAKKEGYLARVRKYFDLLKVGDSDSFDVKHSDGDSLTFLELTKAQNERIEQTGK